MLSDNLLPNSPHLISHHLTSPHITSPHLTSLPLTSFPLNHTGHAHRRGDQDQAATAAVSRVQHDAPARRRGLQRPGRQVGLAERADTEQCGVVRCCAVQCNAVHDNSNLRSAVQCATALELDTSEIDTSEIDTAEIDTAERKLGESQPRSRSEGLRSTRRLEMGRSRLSFPVPKDSQRLRV